MPLVPPTNKAVMLERARIPALDACTVFRDTILNVNEMEWTRLEGLCSYSIYGVYIRPQESRIGDPPPTDHRSTKAGPRDPSRPTARNLIGY